MLTRSDIHDQSPKVIGAFIAIDTRTGDFEEIFIQAFSEYEQMIVEKAVARLINPSAMKLLKQTLLKLGIEILNSILGAKLIGKLRNLKKTTPFSPKARFPNGNN